MKLKNRFLHFFFIGLMSFYWTGFAQASLIFKSNNFDAKSAQLLVVIHGCLQSAESMAMGTSFNSLLKDQNILIFYPQVQQDTHPLDCWSWFLPDNQRPDAGQLFTLKNEIDKVQKEHKLQNQKFHVVGISSGAITASGLTACFPDQVLNLGIHSGIAYGLAQSEEEAQKILKDGPPNEVSHSRPCNPKKYSGQIFIVQGVSDQVVSQKHASFIVKDFLGSQLIEKRDEDDANGLLFSRISFLPPNSQTETRPRSVLMLIRGLGHAWSGTNLNIKHSKYIGPNTLNPQTLPFFSNKGPNASEFFVKEFGLLQKL